MALVDTQPINLLRDESVAYALPRGFPESVSSRMVWTGADLADERQYVHQLTANDLIEIDTALKIFKDHELDGELSNTENFPLPNLRHALEKLRHEVYDGKGLFLIRGLKPEHYSVEDSMVIFMGLQSYIAEQKARQDDQGNMIVHTISDSTNAAAERAMHARHSTKRIAFHTESTGDLLAWQTRSTAASGGRCVVSSAYTVYNILATTCPDIIRTLARPDWPFAFPTLQYRPILYYVEGRLIINYSPTGLLGSPAHPRPASLPQLNNSQRAALQALEDLAEATKLEITTQPGDLHFINNMSILHRRNAFADDESITGTKRHLVRMRLRNQEMGWKLPKHLEGRWNDSFGDEGPERQWHLFPMPEGFFPLRKYPS